MRAARSAPLLAVLAAAVLAAASDAAERGEGGEGGTPRRARSAPAERWLGLIAEYARGAAGGGAGAGAGGEDGDWLPRPIPLTLPLGRGGVPVLLLPLPLPAVPAAPAAPGGRATAQTHSTQCYTAEGAPARAPAPALTSPQRGPESLYQSTLADSYDSPLADRTPRPFEPAVPRPTAADGEPPAPARPSEEPAVPHLDYVVSSQQLVELFQAQEAPQPELPPAVFPDYSGAAPAEAEQGAPPPAWGGRLVRLRRYQLQGAHEAGEAREAGEAPPRARAGAPPAPRIARSLVLRGELTVPRAGYSEPYTVWWDAASGAARVDLHAGGTSLYRALLPDGRVRHVEMRVDRAGAQETRRCAAGAPRPPTAEDRALPGLPDLHAFSFSGYVESEYGRVERWAHAVSGGAGELGGARGEALTFRHELLLARAPDNRTVTPLKYSVQVDSSALGARADTYVHRYTELRDQRHEPGFFVLDLVESCDEVAAGAAPRARLEPLREFTLSYRDPAHSASYDQFKAQHARRYWDDAEEAVRKNLLMQHTRFVASGNRQGATFTMEMNHLGDRLDAELGVLRGVREERGAGDAAEGFPHARDQVEAARARLPRHFDWRQHGAVTHVRNQGSCSSCWAFAVTGAVEGALWLRTRALVPLSEQALVDCAGAWGGHGCGGTWPAAAYEYVRARGLPALAAYPPYRAAAAPCAPAAAAPVTHISSHVNVTRNSVDALKVAIRRHAPAVVVIDSTPKSFVFYKKGVIHDERCAKNKAEHAVLAVGWGVRRGGEEHIIVKNSWSEAWGEGGYARLQARANTCGVLSRPSYPRLERPDVDRLPPTGADAAPAAPAA